MENTTWMGLPQSVRGMFQDHCENALLDSRDKNTAQLSPGRAASLLKRRILGGVQVRLSFQVEPDPLTGEPLFNEDSLFTLHDVAWRHLVGYQVHQRAQHMKVKLDVEVSPNEDALESLRDGCYAEILSYKDRETGIVFKFVGDATLDELRMAAEQYNEKKNRAGKRERRCDAIIKRMKERGATGTTTVSEALERKPTLRAV